MAKRKHPNTREERRKYNRLDKPRGGRNARSAKDTLKADKQLKKADRKRGIKE